MKLPMSHSGHPSEEEVIGHMEQLMRVNVTDTLYVILHKTIICVFVRTSLSSHGVDGSDEQRTVGLRVLHEDDEQLQGSFHHQARLKQKNVLSV